jgi:hypothetical protein
LGFAAPGKLAFSYASCQGSKAIIFNFVTAKSSTLVKKLVFGSEYSLDEA